MIKVEYQKLLILSDFLCVCGWVFILQSHFHILGKCISLCTFINFFFPLKDWMSLISGKAAILEIETKSYEKDSGDLLCMNR